MSVYIMHSDEFISHNIYECFMDTKYLCACLQKIWYNLSLTQGYIVFEKKRRV